jgi:adenine-specific DNA-methyltransferase
MKEFQALFFPPESDLHPEDIYASLASFSHRKRFGQFFTPTHIAEFMVQWVVSWNPSSLLDPAAGTGVFLEIAARLLPKSARLVGYEVEPALIAAAVARLSRYHKTPPPVVKRGDFLSDADGGTFDAVVCNPPYLRYRDFRFPQKVWQRLDAVTGKKLNRMTNAYGLFLVAAVSRLAPKGTAAFIIPSEFLNVDFAEPIKEYLLSQNLLDAIILFEHSESTFNGVLITPCILLLRKDRTAEEQIRIARVKRARTSEDLWHALRHQADFVKPNQLPPNAKWEPLLNSLGSHASGGLVPLGSLARCVRGIATGANSFFTLSAAEVEKYGLEEDVRPCVVKAAYAPSPVFGQKELRRLIDAGKKAFLLWPNGQMHRPLEEYLRIGEEQGIHLRYLPAHRPCWYMPERRKPAPIWVASFGRGRIRFVLNTAGALNLTAFHGLYPQGLTKAQTAALFVYLCSSYGWTAVEVQARRYAGGLLKVEPKDVERILVPDVRALPEQVLQHALAAVRQLELGAESTACIESAAEAVVGGRSAHITP